MGNTEGKIITVEDIKERERAKLAIEKTALQQRLEAQKVKECRKKIQDDQARQRTTFLVLKTCKGVNLRRKLYDTGKYELMLYQSKEFKRYLNQDVQEETKKVILDVIDKFKEYLKETNYSGLDVRLKENDRTEKNIYSHYVYHFIRYQIWVSVDFACRLAVYTE